MLTEWGERAQQMLVEATKGCCRDEPWRGRLCPYHDGYEDGLYVMLQAIEDAQRDGSGSDANMDS